MTDRELLEKAAKAAGLPLYVTTALDGGLWVEADMDISEPGYWWNPLTDDGDALRLAVKLRIVVQHAPRYVVAIFEDNIAYHEDNGADPYAATRRAIVGVATALAQESPEV